MTIDEAIEEQKNYLNDPFHDSSARFREAVLLGIEALKRCKAYKEAHIGLHYTPMPGETEI